MMMTVMNFVKKHLVASLFAACSLGATLGAGAAVSLYEAKLNRLEELKVDDFHLLMTEHRQALELLNLFSEEVARSGRIDIKQQQQLSASLTRWYTAVGGFTVNIPLDSEQPVRQLQSAINNVKKHVQTMQTKDDLDPLSVALVDMFEKIKLAKPIIEGAVGKPKPA